MNLITPKLFLKKGTELIAIEVDQCGPLMDAYKGDRGVSEMPRCSIELYNDNGEEIGEISYNGRIWLNTEDGRIEVPQKGMPTAKELFGAKRG